MKIMICDDQKSELENIRQIVSEYAEENSELFIKIKCFTKPFDMLEEINRTGVPDIALLDICMPGMLGTEIAQEIKSKGENSTDIIFLTTSTEFTVEAFSLHANDYLTKPYTKERLTDALDRVIEKRKSRICIPVTCGREIHIVDLYRILYMESVNHNVEIHLNSENCLKTHTTLTEFKRKVESVSGFVPLGASYIINLRYVQSVLQTTLVMSNGEIIPIPRRLRNEFKTKYFDFYAKEAMEK